MNQHNTQKTVNTDVVLNWLLSVMVANAVIANWANEVRR